MLKGDSVFLLNSILGYNEKSDVRSLTNNDCPKSVDK